MTPAAVLVVAVVAVLLMVWIIIKIFRIISKPPKLVVPAVEDADRPMKQLKHNLLLDVLLHDAPVLETIQLQQREMLAFLLLPPRKNQNNP
jgi:hypothetical protein